MIDASNLTGFDDRDTQRADSRAAVDYSPDVVDRSTLPSRDR